MKFWKIHSKIFDVYYFEACVYILNMFWFWIWHDKKMSSKNRTYFSEKISSRPLHFEMRQECPCGQKTCSTFVCACTISSIYLKSTTFRGFWVFLGNMWTVRVFHINELNHTQSSLASLTAFPILSIRTSFEPNERFIDWSFFTVSTTGKIE